MEDVSPFPRGFAWKASSPLAVPLTEHLHPATPSPTQASSPRVTPATKSSSRPNMTASSTITLDMLRPHFEEPLVQVANRFGICVTLLKKICRRHGIARWPHRQISGLRKSIASMEHAIGYFEGDRRESYAAQLNKQRVKLELLLRDPTSPSLLSPSSTAYANAQSASRSSFQDEEYYEDDQSPQSSPTTSGYMFDGQEYGYSTSAPAYDQGYGYDDYRHSAVPANRFQSQTPVLPPLQGVLRPHEPQDHFQHQPQFGYEQRHQQPFRHEYAGAGLEIPPLQPKPLLPPISSLVVPASGGVRASW